MQATSIAVSITCVFSDLSCSGGQSNDLMISDLLNVFVFWAVLSAPWHLLLF